MSYTTDDLTSAYQHTSGHRHEVEPSGICGCIYCCETFPPGRIERWLNEASGTAVCPECQIDSVIGSASGYPVDDPAFLQAMHKRWFQ